MKNVLRNFIQSHSQFIVICFVALVPVILFAGEKEYQHIRKMLLDSKKYQHPIDLSEIKKIAPHLSQESIDRILKEYTEKGSVYFAFPPLKITDSYHVVQIKKKAVFPNKGSTSGMYYINEPVLDYAFFRRTQASYSDGKMKGDSQPSSTIGDTEAIGYAKSQFGERLIQDSWTDVINYGLGDPTRHSGVFGGCATAGEVYVGLNQSYNDLRNYEYHHRSVSESEVINSAIAIIETDSLIGDEILGGRGGYTDRNCIRCGSGFGIDHCPGCKINFPREGFYCYGNPPLPKRVSEYLISNRIMEDEKLVQAIYLDYEKEHAENYKKWMKIKEQNRLRRYLPRLCAVLNDPIELAAIGLEAFFEQQMRDVVNVMVPLMPSGGTLNEVLLTLGSKYARDMLSQKESFEKEEKEEMERRLQADQGRRHTHFLSDGLFL